MPWHATSSRPRAAQRTREATRRRVMSSGVAWAGRERDRADPARTRRVALARRGVPERGAADPKKNEIMNVVMNMIKPYDSTYHYQFAITMELIL